MNRHTPLASARPTMLIEALEPRIAPAGLLNESKFTSVVVGGSVLLDASGGANDFQGLSTAFGANAGSYLLYLVQGKAVVYTTDLNGNGKLDPGEITGISLGVDSQGRAPELILFSDVHGDIVTNLLPGHGVSSLTDSDNNPSNGRDGRILLDTPIAGITLRTLTSSDLDLTVPGNTVASRLSLTHFSIYGDIISGGDFGGLSIDTSGSGALATKFAVPINPFVYTGSEVTVGGIYTGTAANYLEYHFTQDAPQILAGSTAAATELVSSNTEGTLVPFQVPAGQHGGDISNIAATSAGTVFSIGTIATGDGGIGGARGGNISGLTMHGDAGSYEVLAGNGGAGANGGQGGSILGFNDLGSSTGQVFLHSGDGGTGLLGTGGDGGTATFASTNISADLEIVLGNGGSGFTKGGHGAGITSASIVAPDVPIPIGGKVDGTWHDIGDVGDLHPVTNGNTSGNATYSPEVIDFNGDGIGDAVFTTTNPSQVVIVFGDGKGGITDNQGDFFAGVSQETVVLKVPGGGTPVVTIGDFNGDGKPDIAVASGDVNNFGGIDVYLNQLGNSTLNPVNGSNYTHNPLGDHPFSAPLQSAVPLLNNFGYYGQAGAILSLAAGDYNGDGITDIAYAERVQVDGGENPIGQVVGVLFGEQATSLNTNVALVGAHTATTFVNGSLDNGLINTTTGRPQGTGYFYPNSSPAGVATSVQLSQFFNTLSPVVLHATSLTNTNVPSAATNYLPATPESVVQGIQGSQDLFVFTAFAPDPITHFPTTLVAFGDVTGITASTINITQVHLGQVDTNRTLSTGMVPEVSLQNFILQDFTISDVDQDGRADLIVLSSAPQTFLDAYRGTGTADDFTFVRATVNPQAIYPGDNNGIALPLPAPAAIAITTSDPSGTGRFDGFALVELLTNPVESIIQELRLIPATTLQVNQVALTNDPLGFDTVPTFTTAYGLATVTDRAVNSIDGFYTVAPQYDKLTNTIEINPVTRMATPFPVAGYVAFVPDTSAANVDAVVFATPVVGVVARYLTENGINIYSGNGGNSTNGAGGDAGVIGDGTLNVGTDTTTTASIQLQYTPTVEYSGSSLVQGGKGGNGLTSGGAGGTISGVTARYNLSSQDDTGITETSLRAGNGGNGIVGDGGAGGGINKVSIESGPDFYSGNGGNGLHGGVGGAITGNQATYDTLNDGAVLVTGFGGQGAVQGGAGGTINLWSSQINGYTGSVAYTASKGGNAPGGIGGAGGAITNSPLSSTQDLLGGNLQLLSGAGGSGLVGGAGGLISNFINPATEQDAIPATLTVIAGNGGIGISGVGGVGGAITTFQSNTIGISSVTDANQYNGLARVIAGNGGTSYGGTGGGGGSLTSINATSTSTPLVAAAGAGGDGLTAGGAGGSVSNSILDSAAQQVGKLLIVAGKGGDAYAALKADIFLPNDSNVNDLAHAVLAFGGVTGAGGNGGSVTNVQQPSSVQTSVDIIAGNGGSTPNAGSLTTPTTTVGQGGSISNIAVAGTIGTVSRDTSLGATSNPPIKSYSATDPVTNVTTTSLTDFVNFLASPDSLLFRLDDTVGNVGMVAGAAGTVSGGQPASNGINGSVATVSASSILSIVAGSVDRVAPVSVLSGVTVTSPDGVLGADKSPNSPFGPNGVLDYYNTAGIDVANLQSGYRLIDGAIFASSIVPTAGAPITGPRVFSPAS